MTAIPGSLDIAIAPPELAIVETGAGGEAGTEAVLAFISAESASLAAKPATKIPAAPIASDERLRNRWVAQ